MAAQAQSPQQVAKSSPANEVGIAAQPLEQALKALGQQTGLQIVYVTELVAGKQSRGAPAGLPWSQALEKVLEGTGLTYKKLTEHAVSIQIDRNSSAALQSTGLRLAQADTASDAPADERAAGERSPAAVGGSGPEPETLEEVLVNGRPFTDANVDIVRSEKDVQPYYIFNSRDLTESNTANLEDFLKQKLTMNTVAVTPSQQQGGIRLSTSLVNLRGLGTDQTLILINGRRVAGATSNGSLSEQFDFNAFSPSMIERIEVLPTSASAIYGGSAMGGVVNVILKRDFTGGDLNVGYDTPLDHDAPVRTVSGAYGLALEGGRTHVTLSASYRKGESLLFGDRPELIQRGLSRVAARAPQLLYSSAFPFADGSTTNIASADGSELVLKDGTHLGSSLTYIPTGTSPNTSAAALAAGLLANAGGQNTTMPATRAPTTGLLSPFVGEVETTSVMGAIRRRMSDRLELIAEAFYNSNESSNELGAPLVAVGAVIPASVAHNPFQNAVRVGVPVPTFGINSAKAESFRMVAGFVLDLPYDWRAQGDYTWNRSEGIDRQAPQFDAATARSASRTAFSSGALNPFVDTLAYPLDMSPYMSAASDAYGASVATLADVGLRLSGPIGVLPAGQPNLTVGLEHRKERQPWGFRDTKAFGLTSYFPQQQEVQSVYAEGLVPLVGANNAIAGVRILDLQVAGRYEDFSVSTGTERRRTFPPDHAVDPNEVRISEKVDYSSTNFTAGLRYRPVDSVMLRVSYATAFLPPGYLDLLPGIDEPNAGFGPDPLRGNELFTATWRTGGNPDLEPTKSKAWNIGLMFEPNAAPGLRLGLEWFHIERSNLIFEPSYEIVIANEALFPGRIVRAAPSAGDPYQAGPVTLVDTSLINAAEVATQGVDFSIGYRRNTERFGTFSVDLLGTVIKSFTQQFTLDSDPVEIAGVVANDGPLKLRANATLGWERANWSLSWSALYYGPYDQLDSPFYLAAQGANTIPSQIYHNLFAGYRFADSESKSAFASALGGVSVTLGIRNLFNSVPPFDAYQSGIGYYSPFGDYRLRSAQLSIGKRF